MNEKRPGWTGAAHAVLGSVLLSVLLSVIAIGGGTALGAQTSTKSTGPSAERPIVETGVTAPKSNAPVELGACPWDLNGNGSVDFADLLKILAQWGPCPPSCPWDFNGNGSVDFADLLKLLAQWGPCPPLLLDAFETEDVPPFLSFMEFGGVHPAIPADFFYQGSAPIIGPVNFVGQPIEFGNTGTTDTVIRRLAPFTDPNIPESVPIEIRELNLESIQPIIVGGQNPPEQWMMSVGLSEQPSPPGQLSTQPINPNSGLFDAQVPVVPAFYFVRAQDVQDVVDGNIPPDAVEVRVLDWAETGEDPLIMSWETPQTYVRQICDEYIDNNGLFVFPGSMGPLGFVPGLLDKDGGGCLLIFKPGPMPHVKPGEAHYVKPPNARPGGGPGLRCEYTYSGVNVLRGGCGGCPPAPPTAKGRRCVVTPDCPPFLLRIVRCPGGGFCIQIYFQPQCLPC